MELAELAQPFLPLLRCRRRRRARPRLVLRARGALKQPTLSYRHREGFENPLPFSVTADASPRHRDREPLNRPTPTPPPPPSRTINTSASGLARFLPESYRERPLAGGRYSRPFPAAIPSPPEAAAGPGAPPQPRPPPPPLNRPSVLLPSTPTGLFYAPPPHHHAWSWGGFQFCSPPTSGSWVCCNGLLVVFSPFWCLI